MMKWCVNVGLLILLLVPSVGLAQRRSQWRLPDRDPDRERIRPLPWGRVAAAHLMRRAGFSASPADIDSVVEQGFEATLELLLNPASVDDSAALQGLAARNYQLAYYQEPVDQTFVDVLGLNRQWLYRMVHSRRQLQEKMTLFWHDHFATSAESVPLVDCLQANRRNCPDGQPLMQIQNDTFRTHALGNFKDLVYAVARDPAMIIFLDSFSNVAGNPNENWSRELLELFTMGEGNGYTETDIQQAARAFTGWTLSPQNYRFFYNRFTHDHRYPKIFLGQEIENSSSGVFDNNAGLQDGERVIEIIFEQPQVADFLADKLWEFFVYADPDPAIVSELGSVFRDSGYEISALMRAIFEHPHFMSEKAYRAKVKSPIELAVGAFRELQIEGPDNLPPLLFFFSLGQLLYLPPDVSGWGQDRAWINTGTVLGRFNLFNFVSSNRAGIYDDVPAFLNVDDEIPLGQIIEENQIRFSTDVVDYFVRAMVQDDVTIDTRYTLEQYMDLADDGSFQPFDIENLVIADKKVRGLIFLVSLLPVYQLN